MDDLAVAAALLAAAFAAALMALRCLADRLLASTLIYALGGAALAATAGKLALDNF